MGARFERGEDRDGQRHRESRCHCTRGASDRATSRKRAARFNLILHRSQRRCAELLGTHSSTMLMHNARRTFIMTPGASMVLTGTRCARGVGCVCLRRTRPAIGGFERIMGPNGEAQYYARNLSRRPTARSSSYYDCSYVVPGREWATPTSKPSDPADRRHRLQTPLRPPKRTATVPTSPSLGEIFDDDTNPGTQASLCDACR